MKIFDALVAYTAYAPNVLFRLPSASYLSLHLFGLLMQEGTDGLISSSVPLYLPRPSLFESTAHWLGVGSSNVFIAVVKRLRKSGGYDSAVYVVKGSRAVLLVGTDGPIMMTLAELQAWMDASKTFDVVRTVVSQSHLLSVLSVLSK